MRPRLDDRPAHRRLLAVAALGVMALPAVTGCWGWGGGDPGAEPPPGGPVTAGPSSPAGPSAPASPSTPGRPSAPAPPRPSTPAPRPTDAGTWRVLPASPVSGGPYLAHVWTGTELVIHNIVRDASGTPRVVDAAYNPFTSRWRKLPANPYPVRNTEGGYRAVWTGTEMLAFGQGNAAYNPRTNRWRPIAPGPAGPSVTVWTGRQVLMWGGGCCGEESAQGWAYEPRSNAWRKLPPAPLSGRHTTGVWTGWEMVVAGGTRHGVELTDGAAYNPATRSWRKIASLPAPRLQATLTWTGTEVLMVGGGTWSQWTWRPYQDGLGYNPYTNRWRRLPTMEQVRSQHMAVWTGRRLLVWGGVPVPFSSRPGLAGGAAYSPATNRWSVLPRAPLGGRSGAAAAWTGREMLVWGGTTGSTPRSDGAAYRPPAS